jgi:hypothetical protein
MYWHVHTLALAMALAPACTGMYWHWHVLACTYTGTGTDTAINLGTAVVLCRHIFHHAQCGPDPAVIADTLDIVGVVIQSITALSILGTAVMLGSACHQQYLAVLAISST